MKNFLSFALCSLVFLLVACNSQATALSTAIPQKSATLTATETPTVKPTQTLKRYATLTKTPSPTITPTFDVRTIVTRPPAPRAQCPTVQANKVPDFEYPLVSGGTGEPFYEDVLDFLNAGGPPQAIIKLIPQYRINRYAQIIDLTGDGVPELLLAAGRDYSIAYLCKNGQYERKALTVYAVHFAQPYIFKIQDINRNSIPEIIFVAGDLRFQIYAVDEWDGSEFQVLNGEDWSSCTTLMGESTMETGVTSTSIELVLKQGIPIWSEYISGLPWRKETRTCSWNGTSFVWTNTQLASPEYRFQAMQDGDRAMLAGEYDKALGFYQQVIFDDKLSWWSEKRRFALVNAKPYVEYAPTSNPSMQDAAEYPNLAAYARFRIMLLHIKRGFLPEAQIVYDTLQQSFPSNQPGHAYAEMAIAFMNEYSSSNNLERACEGAIAYTTTHPKEILAYLGNGEYTESFYGDQSLKYVPESVCPFLDDGQ